MPTIYKILGQSNPTASTDTTLYTVPNANSTVVSTITVCNQDANVATFRISVIPGGETVTSKHYINYDTQVPGNDQLALTLGLTLAETDFVNVYANTSTVSFNIFGTELY